MREVKERPHVARKATFHCGRRSMTGTFDMYGHAYLESTIPPRPVLGRPEECDGLALRNVTATF